MDKLLVIEDNELVRENLCEILELANYEVENAENGKLGIQKALAYKPDLIICDVMMPELDGFGVLKIMNQNPKLNHIPLIFLTAKAEKEDLRKGMSLGAEDYITKPFDDVDLLETIKIRLEKSRRIKNSFDKTDRGLQRFFSEANAQEEFEKLSLDKEIRNYPPKAAVFEEDQLPRHLFFVIEGQVKVSKINDHGKELITSICKPGDFFGFNALIHNSPYSNSAFTMVDTSLRLIPKNDFSSLLYNNRDFAAQFVKMLSNHSEKVEKNLIDMAYGSVRKKVSNALLELHAKTDSPNPEYTKLSFSREDLASLAGTAKETLIRTLSDFKSEGLLEIDGKAIIIRDPSKLENLIS